MPWLRVGDAATTHPLFLRLYELRGVDGILRMGAWGFVTACATLSAAHLSDYVVSYGVARSTAGDEESAEVLLDVCERAGLMEQLTIDGTVVWKIPDDPEFIHMRTKAEIEWERQRKTDNANPELVIPVRLRDGDGCRYCGQVVNWKARKGRLRGTYDHRVAGHGATVDTMVVACQGCNAARSNDPLADEHHPLLPAPRSPYFSDHTRDWIDRHEWARANGYSITSRRGRTLPPGTIPDDRKPVVQHHAAAGAAAHRRPRSQREDATSNAGPQPVGASNGTPAASGDTPPPHPSPAAQPHAGERDAMPAAPPPVGERGPAAARQPAGVRAPHRRPAASRTAQQHTPSPAAQPHAGERDDTAPAAPPPVGERDAAADPQPVGARASPPPPAQTPDLLYTADPAGARSTGSGKSGSGRGGTARFGSQTRTSASGAGRGSDLPSPRSRRSRRRSRRR